MIITDLLERNAVAHGKRVALVDINPEKDQAKNLLWQEYSLVESGGNAAIFRKELTWAQFDMRANACANLLRAHGIRKGDKVGILLLNSLEWLPIYFGILKAGAIAVPLNFRYDADEIAYAVTWAECKVLFFSQEFTSRVALVRVQLETSVKHFYYVGLDKPEWAASYELNMADAHTSKPSVDINEDDNAAIYYSSGTTGRPKAILHTHASLYSSAITEQAHHDQELDDVFLLLPPLYHTGAKMHWFGSLMSASKGVLLKGTDPKLIFDTLSSEKVTIIWLLVPWAQDLIHAIEIGNVDLDSLDLSAIRLMHMGAQPIPPSLIKRWKEIFPNHSYDTNYGLSESIGPGAVHLGIENEHKVGAIGKAGHDWLTRIVDEHCEDVAQGDVGELILQGPGLMKEYYKDAESTAATLKDGWLYTGDMAKLDEDGFIHLVDRKKDVIITGGENLYPVEIENFFRKEAYIKDIAVIGMADKRLGEIAVAVIELHEDDAGQSIDAAELERISQALPRYKRPRHYIFDKVPRNGTGKIEKPKLREKYDATNLVARETES
ncbi:MAG: acyl--CoA ligase [Clostridiales Family XIII bacterium]|jgi:acyl-CoA synthetase (AMP-forming)/AMP-acid ligase II|nr:acyl--CoA ligase [Clostridiales Family XIII bacterium]